MTTVNIHEAKALLDNGYMELPVTGSHALAFVGIAPLHKDPFDSLLLAQASAEGFLLLTSDATLARYPGPLRLV
jgi:PIN domain nuclease of toxin-antitoxin system